MRPIKKILAPTDFSTGANAALDTAIGLAGLCGASVTLFHVYQLPLPIPEMGPILTTDMLQAIEASAKAALKEAQAEAERSTGADQAPAITTKLSLGSPYTAIVDEARVGGYDLVVMGTHGRTGLKHLLLGSVAERVVRISPCPVLTVRAVE